jgi:hypothetical protein
MQILQSSTWIGNFAYLAGIDLITRHVTVAGLGGQIYDTWIVLE